MDESRAHQPDPEGGAQPAPALPAGTRLSPVQEAWGDYVRHATHCQICRSIDAGPCEQAEQLHRTYEEAGDNAFRRLKETG